jgi:hypothetical protein
LLTGGATLIGGLLVDKLIWRDQVDDALGLYNGTFG